MTATFTSPLAPPVEGQPHLDTTTESISAQRVRLGVLGISTVLTGLFAGFFFTYSASVVLGFAQVDDLTYVRSFQAINDTIRNPAFAVVFFGTLPLSFLALVLHRADGFVRNAITVGLACTLAVVAITFLGSVPLNNELASYVDLDAASAATARDEFESTWNLLNLIRTVVSIIGATALVTGAIGTRRRVR